MSNQLIVMLAQLKDEERANELLDVIGEGGIDTLEKAGAAVELYALGTDTTLQDAANHLNGLPEPSLASALALQWLQENHPELF